MSSFIGDAFKQINVMELERVSDVSSLSFKSIQLASEYTVVNKEKEGQDL